LIGLTFDDGGLLVNLEQAPQVIGLQLQKAMTGIIAHLHAAVSRNMGAGGLIGVRTGDLRRALIELVTVTDDGVTGVLWPDPAKVAYGGIQEEGGTVVPKHGTALTIPLDAMLTGNGVARGTAAQVRDDPAAFGFKSTFIPKGHSVIMGQPLGAKGGSAIPLFALVQSSTIPGRHYLATTLIQEWQWISDYLESVLGDAVHVLFGEGAFPA
jgi:hypothetical protein